MESSRKKNAPVPVKEVTPDDFLTPMAPMEKIVLDDLDLDRAPRIKTLSEVVASSLYNESMVSKMLAAAEKATEQQGKEIADAEYWSPEIGEVKTIYVTKIFQTVISKKDTTVVAFEDKNNKQWIAGASVLVNTMRKLENLFPCICRVIVTGQQSSENGNKYFTFDVFKL